MIQLRDNTICDSGSETPAESGSLVLRIHGSCRDGEIIRLGSSKCTIGSDPTCTLRIDSQGIHPVHCLVIRGRHVNIVRRWSDDTRLNGEAFRDAELVPGDRLGLGPVDVEIMEIAATVVSAPPSQAGASQESIDLETFRRELTRTRRQGHRRVRLLLEQLRMAREEVEQSRRELQSSSEAYERERTRQAEEMARIRVESEQIAARKEAMDEEKRRREERDGELDDDCRRIDARRADLDVRQAEFEQKLRQWEEEAEERQKQWKRQEREFQKKRDSWRAKHKEIESRLTEWQKELDERESQFRQQYPATATGLSSVGPSSDVPVAPSRGKSPVAEEESVEPSPGNDRADESIDEYMANLMRRLQGIAEIPSEEIPSLDELRPAAVSRQAFLGANHPYRRPEEEDAEKSKPRKKPLPRRRPSVESISTLAAMRELAMASTNSAITAHTQNRLRKSIRGKMILSILSMVLGGTLLVGWMAWGFRGWNLYVGAVGVILSLVWVIQFAVLTGRLTMTRSGNLSWNARNSNGAKPSSPTSSEEPVVAYSPFEENDAENTSPDAQPMEMETDGSAG